MTTFFIISVIILLIYTSIGYQVYKQTNMFSKHMIWAWLPAAFLCWLFKKGILPIGCETGEANYAK